MVESEGEKNSVAAHVLIIHANLLGKRQSADGDMATSGDSIMPILCHILT